MTLPRYIILMATATLFCWGAWYLVVSSINPFKTDIVGFLLFYASTTLALTGTAALIGFFLRTLFVPQEVVFQRVLISFRQGIFLSILIDGLLLLQHNHLLTWYNAVFLIIGLTIAELVMISRRTVRYRS